MVDETSGAPPLDEAALERLTKALDREGVVAAMLIGLQGLETASSLSDVDIAVWHDPELDPTSALQLQMFSSRGSSKASRGELWQQRLLASDSIQFLLEVPVPADGQVLEDLLDLLHFVVELS
jgi:hypothetical protein